MLDMDLEAGTGYAPLIPEHKRIRLDKLRTNEQQSALKPEHVCMYVCMYVCVCMLWYDCIAYLCMYVCLYVCM